MPDSRDSARPSLGPFTMLSTALVFSGAAGLINQVVWQRALKLYLGGSEVISAMVVVLVFMLGLGCGSLFVGFRARSLADPARLFRRVEVALAVVNLAIAWLLQFDLTETVYGFQRAAVSFGVPLRLLYAATAFALLCAPCFLMGMTMPLAAEVSQRQLGLGRGRFLDLLFALNTAGAVVGAVLSGYFLLPYVGQRLALVVAASCNALAAGVVSVLLWRRALPSAAVRSAPRALALVRELAGLARGKVRREELVGFWLGFLALGYEMYLVRLVPLAYEPRPYTFAFIICAFLAFWAIGVYLSSLLRPAIRLHLLLTAVLIASSPTFHALNRARAGGPDELFTWGLAYFVPCVWFGILFGQVINSFAKSWGNDVGRYTGLNTIGSCLGILTMTLLGFELDYDYDGWILALGFVFVLVVWDRGAAPTVRRLAKAASLIALVALVWGGSRQPRVKNGLITYCGREGTIEIDRYQSVFWNGLWHSRLSVDGSHVGTSNWGLAVVPVLCHAGDIEDVLVIGLGTGITAATLARLGTVRSVDAYEINDTLERILRDYPDGTLGVATNPKINIIWRDARSGLALDPKRYDLITQQPLYLKQAGSSILLSREYMQLVSSRLAPGGIFCIYCNTLGNERQGLVVRKTVSEVFPYYTSFGNGYCLIASNEPLDLSPERIVPLVTLDDPFWEEVRNGQNPFGHDDDVFEWLDCPLVVSDDHPIVEYPAVVDALLSDKQVRR